MCCQVQLICQSSGLFLERPELASLNQAAINLGQRRRAGRRGAEAHGKQSSHAGGAGDAAIRRVLRSSLLQR